MKEKEGHWSFFNISGCPRELIDPLFQLAHMAGERESVAAMRFATFRTECVDEIESSLQDSQPGEMPDAQLSDALHIDEEEDMHRAQDHYHCFQAWKLAMLLYIDRVFRWDYSASSSPKRKLMARRTLDHVRSCRRISYVSKQLLLPTFLVGSELKDLSSQEIALEYCTWWHNQSGYRSFENAAEVMRHVWAAQIQEGEVVWWGSIIDEKQSQLGPGYRFKFG